ncbi:MAG: CHC2 zinc finger domain-containing protein [Planctomycetaceae bacterium]|nr:CHC2 zinc finger domain-containing protein [Planctomycetaceae bacterium]
MTDYAFDIKERVRDAIDMVELVSRYIPLRRSGQNYVGRCPWHDDTRPSLQVNANRQTFKCWVCNIGGDVFSFVMQIENVDFREALEILADQAGVQLPKQQRTDSAIQRQYQKTGGNKPQGQPGATSQPASGGHARHQEPLTKKTLYRALDWVAQKYHDYLLAGNEAESARTYLRDRGINEESIRKFRMGYAPLQRDWLLEQVQRNPHRIKILEMIGNLARRDDETDSQTAWSSQPYDRFRGRLLFPIRDTQDRTIAFGGRLLPGSTLQSRAKYVNSPETHLFSKHKQLYGLDLARLTMRNTKRVLIMEGYTDVIMAHQFGFGDAVAVLGTALGAEHIRSLKRFADKMILVLDGDEAGRKRANEVLELFVAQGADIETLTLPGGTDPCDFLLTQGSKAFEHELQHNTVDALEHAFLSAAQGIDLDRDIIAASRALDQVLGIIVLAPAVANPTDPRRIRLEKTIQRLASRFGLTEQEIRTRLRALWDQRRVQSSKLKVQSEDQVQSSKLKVQSEDMLNAELDGLAEWDNGMNDSMVDGEMVEGGTYPETADSPTLHFALCTLNPSDDEFEGGYEPDLEGEMVHMPMAQAAFVEPLPGIPWDVTGVLPDSLEAELIEAWLIEPNAFGVFREKIPVEWLLSPVTRLVHQVCCEFSDRGLLPTFARLMARFDDPKMKTMLVTWDESANEKKLTVNDQLIVEITSGFERRNERRVRPREIGRLKAETLSEEEKLQLLREIQQKQRAKHGIE